MSKLHHWRVFKTCGLIYLSDFELVEFEDRIAGDLEIIVEFKELDIERFSELVSVNNRPGRSVRHVEIFVILDNTSYTQMSHFGPVFLGRLAEKVFESIFHGCKLDFSRIVGHFLHYFVVIRISGEFYNHESNHRSSNISDQRFV